eukprot:TRINITY_DN37131_c0_g1_i1.p2 TRINITY_DN37131_c0_g1~~TRINITY_DN37131_c0_g1_i1.p2  ORF type:complete len:460 (+),score=108.82 TRINITY_DN37131_c0_g1_i1:149-1528(+)
MFYGFSANMTGFLEKFGLQALSAKCCTVLAVVAGNRANHKSARGLAVVAAASLMTVMLQFCVYRRYGGRLSGTKAKRSSDDDDENVCCICLERMDASITIPCGHRFHEHCIAELRRWGGAGRCPLCRSSHESLTPVQVLMERAIASYGRRQYSECYALASEAYRLSSDNDLVLDLFGVLYFEGKGVSQDWTVSIRYFQRASELGNLNAACSLAYIYEKRGEPAAAERLYRVAASKGSANAAYNLGNSLLRKGDRSGAEEFFEAARVRGHAKAAHNLALLHEDRGEKARAETLYEEASRGGVGAASCNLGLLRHGRGDKQGAAEAFQQAYARGYVEAAMSLASLYELDGDVPEAERWFEAARRKTSLRGEASFHLGRLHYNRHSVDTAFRFFSDSSAHGNAAAAFNVGFMLEQRGELWAASDAYDRAASRGHEEAALAAQQVRLKLARAERRDVDMHAVD